MGGKWLNRVSQSERIYVILRGEIESGQWTHGTKLPSLRSLAQHHRTSEFPVRQAMARLAAEGYLERRHGSGTYVCPRPGAAHPGHFAMLCLNSTDHLYGEFTARLHQNLNDLDLFASTLDIGHGDTVKLLRRVQVTAARFVILHVTGSFHVAALEPAMRARKEIIAVVSWEFDAHLDRIHRILVDYAAGSRTLADHLWRAGHRHVLLAGPDNMVYNAATWDGTGTCPLPRNVAGTGFAAFWTGLGGRVTPFHCHHEATPPLPVCDETRLLDLLASAGAPGAVVGMRDVDAWEMREIIRRRQPAALERLTFAGNGDTPWSRASHPPFTTLNWNLGEIADLATGIIRDIEGGKTFDVPCVRLIPPRLVVR